MSEKQLKGSVLRELIRQERHPVFNKLRSLEKAIKVRKRNLALQERTFLDIKKGILEDIGKLEVMAQKRREQLNVIDGKLGDVGKVQCPTCNQWFKNLKRHKCKAIPPEEPLIDEVEKLEV